VGVALVVLLPVATFARDHRWRDHHAILTQPGEGAVNTVAAGTSFVAELQWPAAGLPQALNQLRLSRLNHWLPRSPAHPEVMQGTADFHHQIADAPLPQADPVFDDATAFDTAVDMFDPQPAIVERLVYSLLLQ